VIRTVLLLAFWAAALPFAALLGFPWSFITGRVDFLYSLFMWGCRIGIRLAGIRVEPVGLDQINPARSYIFMSNHVSNLDPPILIPLIPSRTSVMAKKELFRYPILGRAMRMGSLVPVDRGNRDAGIAAVREASAALRQGINMTIFIEGMRSFDGRLLPFKKGPFYLAEASGIPVVPVTVVGTHQVMPKRRFAIKPGRVQIIFHKPIEAGEFCTREDLMVKVRSAINRGLPPELQEAAHAAPQTERADRTHTA
jgi:1-acyl-sn-glycerol-3-phosphate acyltransferase